MAWKDRTTFETLEMQFEISESKMIKIMRKELKEGSFKLWRKRVNSGVNKKHHKKNAVQK